VQILCEKAERFEGVEEEMNRKQYRVWIRLELSGSDERAVSDDKIRVQNLWNCIREQPGRDHYELVVANGEWEAPLIPRVDTLHYEKVRDELEAILGDRGSVRAELVKR
jgi:DNA polymerase-3 subunit alpha